MQKDKKNWTCDFCGKKRDEVHKLIVGSDASICNECVSLCTNILSEEKLVLVVVFFLRISLKFNCFVSLRLYAMKIKRFKNIFVRFTKISFIKIALKSNDRIIKIIFSNISTINR